MVSATDKEKTVDFVFGATRPWVGRDAARTATTRARPLARVTRAGRTIMGLNAMAAMVTATMRVAVTD